jgi:hypothetical protein
MPGTDKRRHGSVKVQAMEYRGKQYSVVQNSIAGNWSVPRFRTSFAACRATTALVISIPTDTTGYPVPRYRVTRWSRIVEDAVVEAEDDDAAFNVADDNDSWRVIDNNVFDTDVEELT